MKELLAVPTQELKVILLNKVILLKQVILLAAGDSTEIGPNTGT